jgi:hypothetical protein
LLYSIVEINEKCVSDVAVKVIKTSSFAAQDMSKLEAISCSVIVPGVV